MIIAMDTQSEMMFGNDADVPTFDMMDPEIESIITLEPDLILASGITMMDNIETDPFTQIRDLGITVAYVPSADSIAGIREDIEFIALVTGTVETGGQIIADMDAQIAQITELVIDDAEPVTVYFEISPAPEMFSFGTGTFLNEMIELAGGVNILADQDGWLPVEAESVVAANPAVIFTNVEWMEGADAEILGRDGWAGVDAVANNRVYLVSNQNTSLPTHHIVEAIRAMAELLHGAN